VNKRRQAADVNSSATSSVVPASTVTSAQAFGPTSHINHQLSVQSSQTGNKNNLSPNVRRSSSVPGPIGAGNPIAASHPTLMPKVISIQDTSEQNKLPQPSDNVSSTAVSCSQSQNFVQQQQAMASQSVESLSSGGRPDGSSGAGSKSSGFMSKIFGKPKDTQEGFQRKLAVEISQFSCHILLKKKQLFKCLKKCARSAVEK
jgi:hypothetical protein